MWKMQKLQRDKIFIKKKQFCDILHKATQLQQTRQKKL